MTALAFDAAIERRAVITAFVIDAISGAPPRAPIRVAIDRRNAAIHVGQGGRLAVSGRVSQLFPDPSKTVPFAIAVHAPRYRPLTVIAAVPPQSAFPVQLPVIALQPLPVRIEGRVTYELDRNPVADATIVTQTSDKLLLLRRPAYRNHPAGTEVRAVTLTPGAARKLTKAAAAGTLRLALDDVSGLAAGDVLRFHDREHGVIDSVHAGSATVTLQHALHGSCPKDADVTPMTVSAPAWTTTTRRDVERGDALLPVSDAVDGDTVAFGTSPEYHDLGVRPDADGYFAVDGVGGERTVALIAKGHATLVTIDYSKDVNPVSIRLKKP